MVYDYWDPSIVPTRRRLRRQSSVRAWWARQLNCSETHTLTNWEWETGGAVGLQSKAAKEWTCIHASCNVCDMCRRSSTNQHIWWRSVILRHWLSSSSSTSSSAVPEESDEVQRWGKFVLIYCAPTAETVVVAATAVATTNVAAVAVELICTHVLEVAQAWPRRCWSGRVIQSGRHYGSKYSRNNEKSIVFLLLNQLK